MAIKWAVSNGDWTATATWNDGTIPQVGDVVYCNGHTISANANINIGNGEIRNDKNEEKNIIAGGYINDVHGKTIIANLVCSATYLFETPNNTSTTTCNIVGNIQSDAPLFRTDGASYNINVVVNGNITTTGIISELFSSRSGSGASTSLSITINGNISTSGSLVLTIKHYTIFINGNINGNVTVLGDNKTINTLNIIGNINQGTNIIAHSVKTFNLDGELNLSGVRPFITGVQTFNVASESHVTYDNNFFYCYNEIIAVDNDFDITCRNQNLDNLQVVNVSKLADTYPPEEKVANGIIYGYSGEYEGSMELIDESVVLAGYHYGNKTGTFAVQVPSALTTKLTEILNKINDAYTRLGNMQTLQNTINDAIAELPSEQFIVETIGG